MRENLEGKLKALPRGPGVYLFRDEAGEVLYVGKAKSLRSRVRSYFQRGDARMGTAQLAERIDDVEVIVTRTEAEALHLEQNLVKRHRPPFNIRLRDDKSFPYIAVTLTDEYPRVMFTRERHRRGTVYFGPYANAKKVRETLDVLNRVFRFRPCEGPRPGRHSGIPCLDFHIDRCFAPCIGAISREDYAAVIDGVIGFLSGDTQTIQAELTERMREAAAEERFEEAARYRNRLFSIRHLADRQATERRAVGTVDVIGLAVDGDQAAVQVFPLRDGKMIDRYGFHLENVAGEDAQSILEAFVLEYYGGTPSTPPEVLVPAEIADTAALSEFLTERRGSRVVVRTPLRGEKRRLVELAAENASLALEVGRGSSRGRAVEAHRRTRGASRGPEPREPARAHRVLRRVEHPGGVDRGLDDGLRRREAEERALPDVRDPRASTGRTTWGRCARPSRVASRARARASPTRASRGCRTSSSWTAARAQLAAALSAMEELDLPRVAVIALAKREEEVFVPGFPVPIALDRTSPALQLLQRIRDEAHRVALRYHRRKRGARSMETIFEGLPGVGPVRRRAIIRHFGSVERFLEASQEELEGVPGLPQKTARDLYAQLHKAGPS